MKQFLVRFVVLFIALWLPVQAIAVPLLAIKCAEPGMGAIHAHTNAVAAHDHAAGEAAIAPDTDDSNDQHGHGSHFCCHHFSAIASSLAFERADLPGFAPAFVLVRDYRFFPEPGKRPPLTFPV